MALKVKDRVKELSITSGTGPLVVTGSSLGFQTFGSVLSSGDTTYYSAVEKSGPDWEVGIGTYISSNNVIIRTTILSSSNNNSVVNFSANTKDVFITYPAERVLEVESGGTGVTTVADIRTAFGISTLSDSVNAVSQTVSASYTQANTATTNAATALGVGQSAFAAANNEPIAKNAFTQANTATGIAQSAYGQANTATTNAATALSVGQNAYAQANTATTNAATALSVGQSAYTQANTATANAATALGVGQSAYTQANTATTVGQSAFSTANSSYLLANSAYSTANTKLSSSGGTVSGSITITQDLTVSGNIYLSGNTTTISSNNLSVNDSLIYLAQDNPANLNDIGIVGHFTSDHYQHTGFVRDASDGIWKLFSNVSIEPSTTIDFTGAIYDSVKVGNVIGSLYGNANTATILQTPRTINGTVFDGSSNITIKSNTFNNLIFSTGLTPAIFDGSSTITISANTGSTTQAGIIQLTDSVSSTSTTTAATPNSVKIAYDQATNAYTQANTATTNAATALGVAQSGFTQANTATGIAQSAYGQANTATTNAATALGVAQSAYGQANTATTNAATALGVGQNAYTQANTATGIAQSAYGQANTATTNAATALSVGQSAYTQANTATTNAATALSVGQSAYTQANTATTNAATALSVGQNAYGQANTATGIAQNSYTQANTATTNAATALGVAQSAFAAANNEPIAKSAFSQANTATTNAATALGVGQSAFNQANTATTNAATALSVGQSAYGQANTVNTLVLARVAGFYQNSVPASANTKDTWIHSDTGVKYENVGDTSNQIWIECGPSGISSNTQPGALVGTTLSVSGQSNTAQLNITYNPATTVNSAIQIFTANTKGGTGYADFLTVTNTSGGATNKNKYFRLSSSGVFEIIDSAYQNGLLTLSDSGDVVVKGNTTFNGIAPSYAPNRPGFRVYGANTSNINATTTLTRNNWAVDWQQGSYLDQSTGLFTAPVAGLYSVNLTARTQTNSYAGTSAITVQKTTGATTTNVCYVEFYNNTSMNHAGSSTIVKLAVGDTLKVVVTSGQITFDLNDNWAVAYIG